MKYAGDSAIFRDFNLFITQMLFKKSVLDSAEMRCLVDWSLRGREDSTFGKSQKWQKLLRTSCEILGFGALRVRFCGIVESSVESANLPFLVVWSR